MKPQVNIIWTFDNEPQQIDDVLITEAQLDDKEQFFKVVTKDLSETEKQTLVKISCCVSGISIPSPKHWYLECNGKFWDDEIPQLMRKVWEVESIIEPIN